MKLTNWPTFISTPFMSPSSRATSSAVRMANCSSSSARRSAGVATLRTVVVAYRVALRAVSFHTRAVRETDVARRLDQGRDGRSDSHAAGGERDERRRLTARAVVAGRPGHRAVGKHVVVERTARDLVDPVAAVVETHQRHLDIAQVTVDGVEIQVHDVSVVNPRWTPGTYIGRGERWPGRSKAVAQPADRAALIAPAGVLLGVFSVYPMVRAMILGQERVGTSTSTCSAARSSSTRWG